LIPSFNPDPSTMHQRLSFHAFTLLAALASSAPAAAQASFDGTDLFFHGSASEAWSVARDGSMVGGWGDLANGVDVEGFYWTPSGGLVGIGHAAGGGSESILYGLSEDGSFGTGRSDSSDGLQAVRWDGTQLVGLGDIDGVAPFASVGRAISADGSVIVGIDQGGAFDRPFKWTAQGGMVDLGGFGGGTGAGRALAVSSDGTYTVGWSDAGPEWYPFLHTDAGGLQPLSGLITGMLGGRATGVSDDGSVVVGFAATSTFNYAFRWKAGSGMSDLGFLPGGMFLATAMACSGDGNVVVGSNAFQNGLEFTTRATIWEQGVGLRELKVVLENDHGLDLTGWELAVATGISRDGNTIVGNGSDPLGRPMGWVVRFDPCPDCIGTSYCGPAVVNSTGSAAFMTARGSTLTSANDVQLYADSLPANRFGYFLASKSQAFIAGPGGSQGNLCLGSPLGRFASQVQNSGANGAFDIAIDLTNIPNFGAVVAGETWSFQCWYRDVNPTSTSNFTDGLEVVFQ